MRKCMAHSFQTSSLVTCTRHLHENTNHKVDSLLGCRTEQRRQLLLNGIFGEEGLVSSTDVISYVELLCEDVGLAIVP